MKWYWIVLIVVAGVAIVAISIKAYTKKQKSQVASTHPAALMEIDKNADLIKMQAMGYQSQPTA